VLWLSLAIAGTVSGSPDNKLREEVGCVHEPKLRCLTAQVWRSRQAQRAATAQRVEQQANHNQQKIEALAQAAFERLKKLEGKWLGRSTKGWAEPITFKTIAQGSVVHESSFESQPNEAMATMYYLDGKRLLLTHYCVSKTQPRLQATAFDEGGRKVTFTFLDGTNLPSRDKGHMDKAVYNFLDDDHFMVRWTWFQDGKEQWLEEIKYERAR